MQRVARLSTSVAAAAKRSRAVEASSTPRVFFSAQPWSESRHEKEDHEGQQHKHDEPTESERFAREFPKPRMDATFLVNNYTAPALAAAYQDR